MTTAVYLGQIGEALDYELLYKLAQEDILLIFIGPIADPRFNSLLRFKNVIWTGEQKQEKAAYLLRLADVGIVPFVSTPLTVHLNANKIYEYMACELPVVATNVFTPRNGLDKLVYMAETDEHFITFVKYPLSKNKAYSDFALSNSWDVKAAEYVELINTVTSTPLPI